jgi:hypothetical protein
MKHCSLLQFSKNFATLEDTQNFKKLIFNYGVFSFLNQTQFILFFLHQKIQLEVLYNSNHVEFSKIHHFAWFWGHVCEG